MKAQTKQKVTQRKLFEQAKGDDFFLRAYVLIRCDLGFATSVAEAVSQIAGVHYTSELLGSPYDVIALVRVQDLGELAEIVLPAIKEIDHVKNPTTAVSVGQHYTGGSRKVQDGWP